MAASDPKQVARAPGLTHKQNFLESCCGEAAVVELLWGVAVGKLLFESCCCRAFIGELLWGSCCREAAVGELLWGLCWEAAVAELL